MAFERCVLTTSIGCKRCSPGAGCVPGPQLGKVLRAIPPPPPPHGAQKGQGPPELLGLGLAVGCMATTFLREVPGERKVLALLCAIIL